MVRASFSAADADVADVVPASASAGKLRPLIRSRSCFA